MIPDDLFRSVALTLGSATLGALLIVAKLYWDDYRDTGIVRLKHIMYMRLAGAAAVFCMQLEIMGRLGNELSYRTPLYTCVYLGLLVSMWKLLVDDEHRQNDMKNKGRRWYDSGF